MRILFITEQFPYPLDTGGNVRTFNILKGIAQDHEITLIATTRGAVLEEHVRAVADFCERVRLVRVEPITPWRDVLTLLASVPRREPFLLRRHVADSVRAEIVAAVADAAGEGRPFDAVHFNHLDAALYETCVPPGVRRIVDQHNIVANQVRTTLQSERRFARRLVLGRDYAKLKTYEAELCNRMDRCLVCSDADAHSLRELGVRSRTVVVPNGVDLDYFVPRAHEGANADRTPRPPKIVFVGTMDYDPCEQGVWYFCNEILPLIRKDIRDLELYVVGRNPSARLLSLATPRSGLTFTGRVADVRPYVWDAAVFVVPLLSGSGTRLKILEAMAMGVPVVTTSIGVEGIDAVDGLHACVADSPADFARATLGVIASPEQRRALRAKARQLVEDKYGWPAICSALSHEYDALAAAV